MAYFKNIFTSAFTSISTTLSCPFSRTHFLATSLLLLSILLLSNSITNHSPSFTASAIASRLLFAASYISPFSSIKPSKTCLVSDLRDNCTLSSVTAMERTRRNSRKEDTDYDDDVVSSRLSSCDIFSGNWVLDYGFDPIYKPGSCPFVDDSFNCFKNGKPDMGYLRYRWKPHGCQIPRFDGRNMLEMLKGKRLVFVGDSLNRNMWESLVCSLRESLLNKTRVFEVSGRKEFRTLGFYSFKFIDYNCSIDFVKSPFLVQEWKASDTSGRRRETLRLDVIQGTSTKYCDADIIIFNTGHWWTHQKTYKGKDYFQEGSHVYNRLEVTEAYTKALSTWAQWVDANVNSSHTRVFFRGYSASHFRKVAWNSSIGRCDSEKLPITNDTDLAPYPWMMSVVESVISEMKTPVFYLNITRMTDYRKDGHPSSYRQPEIKRTPEMIQDCSHWCLPGVPDSWNELLYATLLLSHHDMPNNH
ncbi:protein trichome birefringence-like 4 [Mercurialis annua]|uniref:protein trichome birefringence-like 4 n=1 Tax=Mercurialis annua TaxID=3986 RepID=UPI002160A098|nr:protein trichome birefringence-like 4 [Mercurialis annua]